MNEILIEIAGWIGMVLILAAFALNINGKIEAKSATYQWMNIIGSVGFIINTGAHGAIPPLILNIIWAILGLIAVIRGRTQSAQA
jgi:hypothetical protein